MLRDLKVSEILFQEIAVTEVLCYIASCVTFLDVNVGAHVWSRRSSDI